MERKKANSEHSGYRIYYITWNWVFKTNTQAERRFENENEGLENTYVVVR